MNTAAIRIVELATNLSPEGAARDRTQACPPWSCGASPYFDACAEIEIWAITKTTAAIKNAAVFQSLHPVNVGIDINTPILLPVFHGFM